MKTKVPVRFLRVTDERLEALDEERHTVRSSNKHVTLDL